MCSGRTVAGRGCSAAVCTGNQRFAENPLFRCQSPAFEVFAAVVMAVALREGRTVVGASTSVVLPGTAAAVSASTVPAVGVAVASRAVVAVVGTAAVVGSAVVVAAESAVVLRDEFFVLTLVLETTAADVGEKAVVGLLFAASGAGRAVLGQRVAAALLADAAVVLPEVTVAAGEEAQRVSDYPSRLAVA